MPENRSTERSFPFTTTNSSVPPSPELAAQSIVRSLLDYLDEWEDRQGESPENKVTKDDKGPEDIVGVPAPGSALQLNFTSHSPAESEEDNKPEQDPPPSREPQGEQDPVREDTTRPVGIVRPWIPSCFDEYNNRKQVPIPFSDYSTMRTKKVGRQRRQTIKRPGETRARLE